MKTLKYLIIAVLLVSGLSSCLVVRDRPGYYHPRPHYHHHWHGGYY
ncbi:hypothetical protein ACTJJ0_32950 [Chitinophaga sp. 22321]|uniref:Lipoprotein n=1 Tax=Chitinophaga hostae TaxID=2831022 RepID=A0ABS5J9F5_9BACT|nr:hypothetical protein [Chitinophaga hostae]MBS0031848.1 hypothetical protein [Chitinophaga hostae]